jgi:hypothetical protein
MLTFLNGLSIKDNLFQLRPTDIRWVRSFACVWLDVYVIASGTMALCGKEEFLAFQKWVFLTLSICFTLFLMLFMVCINTTKRDVTVLEMKPFPINRPRAWSS